MNFIIYFCIHLFILMSFLVLHRSIGQDHGTVQKGRQRQKGKQKPPNTIYHLDRYRPASHFYPHVSYLANLIKS